MKSFKQFAEFTNLTKTEKEILDQAHKAHNNRISVTSKIGPKGHEGVRQKTAFHSLVKKGHLIHEPEYSSSETVPARKKRKTVSFHTVVGRLNPNSAYKPDVKEATEKPYQHKKCAKCKGTGTVMRHFRNGGVWSLQKVTSKCSACHGTGQVLQSVETKQAKNPSITKIMNKFYNEA